MPHIREVNGGRADRNISGRLSPGKQCQARWWRCSALPNDRL